jgi:hypothetical protein
VSIGWQSYPTTRLVLQEKRLAAIECLLGDVLAQFQLHNCQPVCKEPPLLPADEGKALSVPPLADKSNAASSPKLAGATQAIPRSSRRACEWHHSPVATNRRPGGSETRAGLAKENHSPCGPPSSGRKRRHPGPTEPQAVARPRTTSCTGAELAAQVVRQPAAPVQVRMAASAGICQPRKTCWRSVPLPVHRGTAVSTVDLSIHLSMLQGASGGGVVMPPEGGPLRFCSLAWKRSLLMGW